MNIYPAEKHLESQINTGQKILAHCKLSPCEFSEDTKDKVLKIVASEYDNDLYPVSTILVSAGWNKNDDVFDAEELWAAQYSPTHKPLNKEHKSREIVGHITHSVMVDDELNILDGVKKDDTKCHILAEGVVYRHVGTDDEELQEETNEFIEELKEGEWYVSMETLFNNFDYAVEHPTLGSVIIPRNEETSHLTQYLRCYGGTGQFQDFKIGRLLRNMTFSAEGFVKNPANPRSLVLNNRIFAAKAASQEMLNYFTTATVKENRMSDDFKVKYDEAVKQINELRDKLAQADVKVYEAKIDDLEKNVASLNEQVKTKDDKIEELETTLKAKHGELDKSQASVKELETKVEESAKALEEIQSAKLRTDRISLMIDAGIERSEAEVVVDKFINLNDEQFGDIVEMKKSTVVADKEDVDEGEDKKGEASAEDIEIEEEKVDDDLNLSTASVDDDDEVIKQLEEYFTQALVKENK